MARKKGTHPRHFARPRTLIHRSSRRKEALIICNFFRSARAHLDSTTVAQTFLSAVSPTFLSADRSYAHRTTNSEPCRQECRRYGRQECLRYCRTVEVRPKPCSPISILDLRAASR